MHKTPSRVLGSEDAGRSAIGAAALGLFAGLMACLGLATLQDHHAGLHWVWAFRSDVPCASAGVWYVVVLVSLLCPLVTTLAARCTGWARLLAHGLVWALGIVFSFSVLFGNHGGDSTANLFNHITATRTTYPLFVGGELLGYLWYLAVERMLPTDEVRDLFMAARISGWLGFLALLICANQIASLNDGLSPLTRGLTVSVACVLPYLILFGAYPQSSSLMLALVPVYLALGLAAFGSWGNRSAGYAAGAGGVLAIACAAHGAAYFLGLSAAFFVVRSALARRLTVAGLFAVTFLVFWVGLTLAEHRMISLAENTPWTVLAPDYDADRLWNNMHGPIGLAGPSPCYDGKSYWEILAAWVASTTPTAPFLLAVAVLGWARLLAGARVQRRFPTAIVPADALVFLGSAAVGSLLLWSIWDAWFGYPSDWDTTAIASITLHLFAVAALCVAPWTKLRLLALGFALPVQAFVLVQLALEFIGPSRL